MDEGVDDRAAGVVARADELVFVARVVGEDVGVREFADESEEVFPLPQVDDASSESAVTPR